MGLALGSFINVVALRYDPDRFIFSKPVVGGRSYCPHCGKTLRWFELLPVVSFVIQRRRCRTCASLLSYQYPLSEAVAGLIAVLVPMALPPLPLHPAATIALNALWVAVFLLLLLMALIDIRLQMIPDEIVIALIAIGLGIIILSAPGFGLASGTFLRDYALMFGLRGSIWLNHIAGLLFGGILFGAIIALTRGRGMGFGDLKLALALGFVFGWPDIILVAALSFIIGSIYGGVQIWRRREKMKSAVPFGPFLALGAAILFFFGNSILRGYFALFGI